MDKHALLEQRKTRIFKAIRLEKPDRIPVVIEMAAFAAKVVNMPMSEFVADSATSADAMLRAYKIIGDADAIDYPSMSPTLLAHTWLSKVKLPGRDLPENDMWQIEEAELMQPHDYDFIVSEGWLSFLQTFKDKHFGPDLRGKTRAYGQSIPGILNKYYEEGIPVLDEGLVTTPYEMFCGARSMVKFIHDLFEIPDKVQAAMDVALPFMTPKSIQSTQQLGLPCMWVGGWRSASAMLSRHLWDRFVYPYFEKIVYEVVEGGITPILHLDSDWTRDLERFRSLPAKKCVLSLDGQTNIFKAKEVLGDHMCIMGDVPPTLLALGNPDAVYKYCTNLIQKIGPEGYILHSGCDIPLNAKLENVQAMVAAATGK